MDIPLFIATALPPDFFTLQSFESLVGLSGITFVLTNTLRRVWSFNPAWLGLLIAVAATEFGCYYSGHRAVPDYVINIVNGCLVFLTAAGGNEAVSPRSGANRGVAPSTFFRSWF